MAAFASKRVLVVGPEDGLAAQVAQELEAGNSPITFVADSSVNWQDREALDALFGGDKPSLLLHELDLAAPDFRVRAADELRSASVQRARLLGAACAKHGCVAIHLSDYHVFGGDTKNAYDEADMAAPLDSFGRFVADLEQAFVTAIDRHMILRFSWLIDPEGDNLFTRVLDALCRGDHLHLSPYRRGAPTWKSDARRVICGVLRQVMSGAQNWGYFHYCSADNCNEWEFGSEVEATLAELHHSPGTMTAEEKKESDSYPMEPASATLNSRRIRNNFGVHGRSWRQGLKSQINHWLDQQTNLPSACSSAG